MVRMKSPPAGSSILMTSAPMSPSSPAQNGARDAGADVDAPAGPRVAADRRVRHAAVTTSWPGEGGPSTRSPRIVRWISFVPAHTRRRLVVEPRALPLAAAGVVVGLAPQRRGVAEHGHDGVVHALGHLAPVQLQRRLPSGPGSRPLASRLIDRRLWSWNRRTSTYAWARRCWSRTSSIAPFSTASLQQLLEELDVDDELARVGATLVRQRRVRDPPAVVERPDELVGWDEGVSEVDLVELGLAGELHERSHLDARGRSCRPPGTRCPCASGRRDRCGRGTRPSSRTGRRTSTPSGR